MDFSPLHDSGTRRSFALPPMWILLLLVFAVLVGYLIGGALSALVVSISHKDMAMLLEGFGEQSPYADRQVLRWASLLSHFCSFTLPSLGIFIFLYRKRWAEQLHLNVQPVWKAAALSIIFIMVSFPFAQTIYWLNRQLPLPEWMTGMENEVSNMVQGLLVMDSPGEFLFNLVVVALVPAIGEELVFRGIVQQQLYRIARTPVLAVWITAFIFSAFHLQFEGFLPRFLLGGMLGYLFLWSKNLWVPIIAHFFFNGLQVAGQYFAGDAMESIDASQKDQPYWVMGLFSLLMVLVIANHLRRYYEQPPPVTETEVAENESST